MEIYIEDEEILDLTPYMSNDFLKGDKGDKGDTYTITSSDYQAIANVVEGDIQSTLDGKVDKVTGKGLSTNDFTDTYKDNVDSNTSARHTHSNKSVLDDISSTDITNWNDKYAKPSGGIPSTDMTSAVQTSLGKADSAIQDISMKQDIEDNTLTTNNKTVPSAINEVNSIAKGANQALSYASYSAMVTAFNSLDDDVYNIGQNIYIVTTEVPDLWISSVESTSSTYTYVDDATIVSALQTNGYIQVGYYKLSMLETQKVDLTDYVKNTDYATGSKGGVIKANQYANFEIGGGQPYCSELTYAQYQNRSSAGFISRTTLENVITGKELVNKTYVDNIVGDIDTILETLTVGGGVA